VCCGATHLSLGKSLPHDEMTLALREFIDCDSPLDQLDSNGVWTHASINVRRSIGVLERQIAVRDRDETKVFDEQNHI
jgi:hypothetical protein